MAGQLWKVLLWIWKKSGTVFSFYKIKSVLYWISVIVSLIKAIGVCHPSDFTFFDFFLNGVFFPGLTEHTSSSLANIWNQENHSKWLLLFSRIPTDEPIIYLELHMQTCPPQFKFKFQERGPLLLVKSVSVTLGPPS